MKLLGEVDDMLQIGSLNQNSKSELSIVSERSLECISCACMSLVVAELRQPKASKYNNKKKKKPPAMDPKLHIRDPLIHAQSQSNLTSSILTHPGELPISPTIESTPISIFVNVPFTCSS